MIPKEFIAWDKENKKWVDIDRYNDLCITSGKVHECADCLSGAGLVDESDRYTPYQYIGRLDKNGNKIYEGSILETRDTLYDHYVYIPENERIQVNKWLVYYNDFKFKVSRLTPENKYCRKSDKLKVLKYNQGIVIGHIAEDK